MKTVGIIIARMGSSRLPSKVLMLLAGQPVLQHVCNAVKDAGGITDIIVATTIERWDDVIVEWCKKNGIAYFRGSENDVLDRFYGAAVAHNADIVVRVTADCPFLDPKVIDEVLTLREVTNADYASNVNPPTYPDGLDCEAFTIDALATAHRCATRPTDRETVTQYIMRNRSQFRTENLVCPIPGLDKERWVLDTAKDLKFCEEVAKRLNHWPPSYLDIKRVLDKEPDLRKINSGAIRNERFHEAISKEDYKRSYSRSKSHLEKAEKIIPLATQTFSKSRLMLPKDDSPLFLSHGDGGYVYDLDGNDYVDLVGALLPVVLGYRDPDVDGAIRKQLSVGYSLSLASELEYDLAAALKSLIPCAEKVKFGKNGSDVTTAAIRLARYWTGRDGVVLCGYHGWHDWSIGWDKQRNQGVPAHVQRLSHKVDFGDIKTIDQLARAGRMAAVIVEPDGSGYNDDGFLFYLKSLCEQTHTVLIFDEIITGFRWALGGYQSLCEVIPDLACFGKSMANGMPISALVGRADIMKYMDRICYSGTFFGDTLAMAAALETIKKMKETKAISRIWSSGNRLKNMASDVINAADIGDAITLYGNDPLVRLNFKNKAIQSVFMKEMIANGVLMIASHNVMAAHENHHFDRIRNAYGCALNAVKCGESAGKIEGTAVR